MINRDERCTLKGNNKQYKHIGTRQ